MPANAFNVFMGQHAPLGELVTQVNTVLWDEAALSPFVKERMRIALAEALGCSYCARFRTDVDGKPVLDKRSEVSAEDERKAVLAEQFASAAAAGTTTDADTVDMQQEFSREEFADLVFSMGWFIGMQHVGRLMHWDDACPVAPIRALVQSGGAA